MTKLLIADDEPPIRTLTKAIFSEKGFDVVLAVDGQDAINKIKSETPDLVLTDVLMPHKTGFEVCEFIKNDPQYAEIPVIIISALGDIDNKMTGFNEGADDYITKPFNIEELQARVNVILERKRNLNDSDSQNTSPADTNIQQCSTGISDLDAALNGGLPTGSNILIKGPKGIGKTSFAAKFISQGLNNDEPALVVGLDENPITVRKRLNMFTSDALKGYESKRSFALVDAYSCAALSKSSEETYQIQGTLELNELCSLIADAGYDIGQSINKKHGGRRVVDSISSLFVNFDLKDNQRFINQVARTAIPFGNVTTLFLLEEGSIDDHSYKNIDYIMDGIINFRSNNDLIECKIETMKWVTHTKDWFPVSFNF